MVLPGDSIDVSIKHVGMKRGCKVLHFKATVVSREETVLRGVALVMQPPTVYLFTGQGSQTPGMGMDLYTKSDVARQIWDRADTHLMGSYGFSILDIVRRNPKELTVYFGGSRGKAVRQTYMALTDGSAQSQGLFKNINEQTPFYTYRSSHGLLMATQFAQPALVIMQLAAFRHSQSRGVIQDESFFAGHSLGEYSALVSVADLVPFETLLSIVFYRGLCMQDAVERDAAGRSNYGMCAVDPSRLGALFTEETLKHVIQAIVATTGAFLEIVNFNIQSTQYVCAGTLRGLDILSGVLDALRGANPADFDETLVTQIRAVAIQTDAKAKPIQLARSKATIPLSGIDVPFHSSYLAPRIDTFRSFLLKHIPESRIDPSKLVGKYIPNVTAKPFDLSRSYFEDVFQITKSSRIGTVLRDWQDVTAIV